MVSDDSLSVMTELDDWQILLGLFPFEWRQLGRSSGAVRRLRGFPSLDALLRTLLLHVGCGWSLRETSVQAKLAGIAEISDVTLLNRLRDAENWSGRCARSCGRTTASVAAELWRPNGTLTGCHGVREPGKTGSQWRIHYSLRLPTLECDHFDLTSTRGTGAAERFGRFRFRAGELVLADAGYRHLAGVAAVVAAKADVCVRLSPHGLPVFDEKGSRSCCRSGLKAGQGRRPRRMAGMDQFRRRRGSKAASARFARARTLSCERSDGSP